MCQWTRGKISVIFGDWLSYLKLRVVYETNIGINDVLERDRENEMERKVEREKEWDRERDRMRKSELERETERER